MKLPMRVEIQQGSRIKYEFKNGELYVDRIVALGYPAVYGFIENTLAPDGDALDVVLLTNLPLQPGCIVSIEPVGYLAMTDQDVQDDKILAIISDTEFEEESDTTFMLKHFFSTYKSGIDVSHIGFDILDSLKALEEIERAQKAFMDKKA